MKGIKGIDNDMSFGNGKLSYAKTRNGYNRIRRLTHENIKGMPIALVNAIMNLNESVMTNTLCDILNEKELSALRSRLRSLKKDIADSMDQIGLKKDMRYSKANNGKNKDYSGRYYYEGEDQDDVLRQLKQLEKVQKMVASNLVNIRLSEISVFRDEIIDMKETEKRIEERKSKQCVTQKIFIINEGLHGR